MILARNALAFVRANRFPILLWLSLWAAINTGPWVYNRDPRTGVQVLHFVRASFPPLALFLAVEPMASISLILYISANFGAVMLFTASKIKLVSKAVREAMPNMPTSSSVPHIPSERIDVQFIMTFNKAPQNRGMLLLSNSRLSKCPLILRNPITADRQSRTLSNAMSIAARV